MTPILAIDPGTERSAFVMLHEGMIVCHGLQENAWVLGFLESYRSHLPRPLLAVDALTLRPGETLHITGPSGSGKTTFADELARRLREQGHQVERVRLDDYLAPRAVRHARGRHSPEGFYLDSYDLEAFRRECLYHYAAIIDRDPSQKVFWNGWRNRIYRDRP